MNYGVIGDVRILKTSTQKLMWKPSKKLGMVRPNTYIGLTWFLQDHNGQLLALHNGQDPGFQVALRLLPAHKLGVIVLANSDQAGAADLADWIYRLVLGEE
jgi:CubicO group peptidase (beta-lactamase class C family)